MPDEIASLVLGHFRAMHAEPDEMARDATELDQQMNRLAGRRRRVARISSPGLVGA